MLYGTLGVDFVSTLELPHPKTKFYAGSKQNYTYVFQDWWQPQRWSWNSPLFASDSLFCPQEGKSHKSEHACICSCSVQLLEFCSKDFEQSCQTKSDCSRKLFINCPVCLIAVARKKNSSLIQSYTKNRFLFRWFDRREFRILRGGQPLVDFDAASTFYPQVMTMKAMSFQDDFLLTPFIKF